MTDRSIIIAGVIVTILAICSAIFVNNWRNDHPNPAPPATTVTVTVAPPTPSTTSTFFP